MSTTNCNQYVTCDNNSGKSNEAIMREAWRNSENGCPALAVTIVEQSNADAEQADFTHYRNTSLSNVKQEVAASIGANNLYVRGLNIINTANTSDVYIKFSNQKGTSTTVGTTVPVLTIHVPAGASLNEVYNAENIFLRVLSTVSNGGLTVWATTVLADTGTQTAPTTGVHVGIQYDN